MKPHLSPKDRKLAEAALKLIAAKGWAAAKAQHPAQDLAGWLVVYVTDETAKQVGRVDVTDSPHDRLFEVLMARLDVLQANRKAVIAIIDGLRHDPAAAMSLIRAQGRAMQEMLELAGLGEPGPRGIALTAGLGGIYAATLCRWRNDTSADMAATMSFLDRHLRRAGKIAEILFQSRQSPPPAGQSLK